MAGLGYPRFILLSMKFCSTLHRSGVCPDRQIGPSVKTRSAIDRVPRSGVIL
jgi:hypothetical protein